ncbi:MAG TPA: hypothetical protein VH157_00555 [Bryobacteraceae bacterium]|nr:hypothetical protein [Bryobacteraceae bacterium]
MTKKKKSDRPRSSMRLDESPAQRIPRRRRHAQKLFRAESGSLSELSGISERQKAIIQRDLKPANSELDPSLATEKEQPATEAGMRRRLVEGKN